ncbi:MAG: hotdog fold thioesterase [Bacteroidales bacterium]
MPGHLGIEFLEAEDGFIKGKMPVDERTKQPFGLLHGGAAVTLAETLASAGAMLSTDKEKTEVRAATLTAHYIGAVRRNNVYGEAKRIHQGKMSQVWDVAILDEGGYRIAEVRITVHQIPRKTE